MCAKSGLSVPPSLASDASVAEGDASEASTPLASSPGGGVLPSPAPASNVPPPSTVAPPEEELDESSQANTRTPKANVLPRKKTTLRILAVCPCRRPGALDGRSIAAHFF